MKDIVIVYGTDTLPTAYAMNVANYYGLNVVREGSGEWPCPLSMRKVKRVLQIQMTPDFEWIGRLIREGYTPMVVHYTELPFASPNLELPPAPVTANTEPCPRCGRISSHPEGWHYCHKER